MLTNLEETVAAPLAEEEPFTEEEPFAYGDQTVVQLRSQPFTVQDDAGTVVMMPIDTAPTILLDTVFAEEEPMARVERKLDTALRQIAALQQRLESLDVTLARALAR
jgi:hypothetical protein